jgi:poly-gamma-glutamate synthesis protein (capsule biosynthesis protein)
LGVFLVLQALFLVVPSISLLSVRPLSAAAGRVSTATGAGAAQAPAAARQPDPAAADNQGGPLTLAFAGDVHFEDFLGTRLQTEGSSMLQPLGTLLAGADVSVVNLESAVTDRGAAESKQFTFRAPAGGLSALRAAGVSAVSMANNHGLDYGQAGLRDSLAAAGDIGMPVLGIGLDAGEAYRPWVTTVRGRRVAVIAATQVLDDPAAWTATAAHPGVASAKDVPRLLASVQLARSMADTVVVFLHWGIEGETCPTGDQVTLADRLIGAGADVIVGGHAHRLQAAGKKHGALVAYGLGNAVFYSTAGPSTESGVLKVTVDGRKILGYGWTPARLVNGVATELTGQPARVAFDRWLSLRACSDLQS